jgi:hypothetical protein
MAAGIIDQVRLLHEWSPLLGYLRRLSKTLDARDRALVITDLAEWLASKTATRIDDRLVSRMAAVVKTPEGEALVRDLVALADAFLDSLPETSP